MANWKHLLIATLVGIPTVWALRAQTPRAGDAHGRGLPRDSATRRALSLRRRHARRRRIGVRRAVRARRQFRHAGQGYAPSLQSSPQRPTRIGPALRSPVTSSRTSSSSRRRKARRAARIWWRSTSPKSGKPTTILHGGHYDDVYVKTPQGWRIKSRTYVRSEIGPQPAVAKETSMRPRTFIA